MSRYTSLSSTSQNQGHCHINNVNTNQSTDGHVCEQEVPDKVEVMDKAKITIISKSVVMVVKETIITYSLINHLQVNKVLLLKKPMYMHNLYITILL